MSSGVRVTRKWIRFFENIGIKKDVASYYSEIFNRIEIKIDEVKVEQIDMLIDLGIDPYDANLIIDHIHGATGGKDNETIEKKKKESLLKSDQTSSTVMESDQLEVNKTAVKGKRGRKKKPSLEESSTPISEDNSSIIIDTIEVKSKRGRKKKSDKIEQTDIESETQNNSSIIEIESSNQTGPQSEKRRTRTRSGLFTEDDMLVPVSMNSSSKNTKKKKVNNICLNVITDGLAELEEEDAKRIDIANDNDDDDDTEIDSDDSESNEKNLLKSKLNDSDLAIRSEEQNYSPDQPLKKGMEDIKKSYSKQECRSYQKSIKSVKIIKNLSSDQLAFFIKQIIVPMLKKIINDKASSKWHSKFQDKKNRPMMGMFMCSNLFTQYQSYYILGCLKTLFPHLGGDYINSVLYPETITKIVSHIKQLSDEEASTLMSLILTKIDNTESSSFE